MVAQVEQSKFETVGQGSRDPGGKGGGGNYWSTHLQVSCILQQLFVVEQQVAETQMKKKKSKMRTIKQTNPPKTRGKTKNKDRKKERKKETK